MLSEFPADWMEAAVTQPRPLIEVYRQVQREDSDLAKRIIFTTGDTISPDTHRFLEETGAPYLSKSFELAGFIKTMREATSRR
jgi:hypothetical protein